MLFQVAISCFSSFTSPVNLKIVGYFVQVSFTHSCPCKLHNCSVSSTSSSQYLSNHRRRTQSFKKEKIPWWSLIIFTILFARIWGRNEPAYCFGVRIEYKTHASLVPLFSTPSWILPVKNCLPWNMPSLREITALSRHYTKLGKLWWVHFVFLPFLQNVTNFRWK